MNPVLLSSLSLAVLIGVIALGFLKKWNVGILSFGAAMLMGMAAGMTQKQIVAGFNTSLFVILLGSMFLFSIAQLNGTMDLLAKKTVALAGGRGWAVPIFMYLLGAVVAALGPGTIPGFGIAAMFGVPLALEMKAAPFLFCTIGQMGAIAGGIVPWAPTGVAGISKAAEAGYTEHVALPLFLNTLFGTIFVSILLFVLYRGWRIKGSAGGQRWRDIPRFDRNQRLTLVAILVMVVCVIVLKTDIGLTCFLLACILIALKVSEFSACVQAIPWNTILLVVGIGVLMNVVITAGGIELLARGLASIMIPRTAPALLALASGIMSWFSSTSGVVMPTMIPTVPAILEQLGPGAATIPPMLMVSALTVGSSCAGISPASTGGGLIMASLASDLKDHNIPLDYNQLFIKLFLTSIFSVLMAVLFALIGGYNFTPYG